MKLSELRLISPDSYIKAKANTIEQADQEQWNLCVCLDVDVAGCFDFFDSKEGYSYWATYVGNFKEAWENTRQALTKIN